jgi:hypothetical protein
MVKKTPKFERCVMQVKSKQPLSCKSQKWTGSVRGKKCYNPWAVCHSSLGKSAKKKSSKKQSAKKKSSKIYIGPRGGRYTISKSGAKKYIS